MRKDEIQKFELAYQVLKENPHNYQGYKVLGDFYCEANINQAYLCYEQAWGICNDLQERMKLEELMQTCRKSSEFQIHPASFIILSYNAKDMMIDCLESIRGGCVPGSYEIVVVDNDSQDGIRDYLVEQKDIKLQLNNWNAGFPKGCNQGVKLADPDNDIFLLNNDTIVPPFALFYMRMSLYSEEDIASVGPTTNDLISPQVAPGNYQTKEQWISNARNIHRPSLNANENRVWLIGFALLIRRRIWDYVGYLDERFMRGNYEDTDYGFRLLKAGYRNVLCHNAFIYHYTHVSMKKDLTAYYQSMRENKKFLMTKLGFDFDKYTSCFKEMVDMINASRETPISILEIGCGLGQTLSKIKYLFPNSRVVGIENDIEIANIGKQVVNMFYANIETDTLPFERETFDYLFLTDVINRFKDSHKAIMLLKRYLRENGQVVLLSRNLLYGEKFVKILEGKFETANIINDSEIKHYYTKDETWDLLLKAGLVPRFLLKIVSEPSVGEKERRMLDALKALPNCTIGEELNVVSYIITATLQ